MRLIKKRWQSN